MKIFVSGAAGQVGSHVVDEALGRGDEVVGVDNFDTGRPEPRMTDTNLSEVQLAT